MVDLYLMRHAKSSWDDVYLDDFDRPLNKRGKVNATEMGALLSSRKLEIDRLFCSSAVRCKSTFKCLLNEGFGVFQQSYSDDLYSAGFDGLMEFVKSTSDNIKSLMIIGHNPGLQDLALNLLEVSSSDDYKSLQVNLPSCAFLHIQIKSDKWSELAPGCGTLYYYVTPKQLIRQDY